MAGLALLRYPARRAWKGFVLDNKPLTFILDDHRAM